MHVLVAKRTTEEICKGDDCEEIGEWHELMIGIVDFWVENDALRRGGFALSGNPLQCKVEDGMCTVNLLTCYWGTFVSILNFEGGVLT